MSNATIADQAGEMKRASAENPSMSAFLDEQNGLAGAPVPAGVGSPGDALPDADLQAPDGSGLRLSEAVGEGPAVLVFYRGAWCPFCNLALRTYQQELLSPLTERGVGLVAISPQTPDGSLTIREKHELSFAVLSDPGNALAAAIGILTEPTPEALAAQRDLGLDLEDVNADGSTAIPMPTTAIVDSELQIRWIDVHPDYTTRTEPAEILAALDALGG